MDIKGRIRQSIRRRKDGILLRSNLTALGSRSQISVALLDLCEDKLIECISQDVYVLPAKLAVLGKETLLFRVHQRQEKARLQAALRNRRAGPITATARYVSALAKQHGIIYNPTFYDCWTGTITRLADDEITSDDTDNLLVALTRNGALSPGEMIKLVMNHHRELNLSFGTFGNFKVAKYFSIKTRSDGKKLSEIGPPA